jgi:MoaA/NifB/PqqE/SkfB family radical SAM enzyme
MEAVQMFNPESPYTFHIELTDKCNAGCPMCPRTDRMNRCRANRAVVANVELTPADFEMHFTADLCRRTAEVIFGGAYGDPLAANGLLEIAEHLTERGVRIAISTNGSLRTPGWWARLGRSMARTGSRLELHVDGLEDTNALYRVNTSYAKIMENAAAYIATGARAEWRFIIFRHNEHQIEEAFRRSRAMGFAQFTLIDTVRFGKSDRLEYVLPSGQANVLEAPTRKSSQFRLEGGDLIAVAGDGAEAPAGRGDPTWNGIACKSASRNSPYISAHGQVSACCWVAGSGEEAGFFAQHRLEPARYNIRNRPLEEIMADEPFASLYRAAWEEDCLPTCRTKCGRMRRNRVVNL